MEPFKQVYVEAAKSMVCLVPRDQLRHRSHGRTFRVPVHLKGLLSSLPTPPAVFSWSKNNTVKYPILGNDNYGDCYYAAVAHASQTWTANSGTECSFDVNALIARYKVLSGGDNGLNDAKIMPEWRSGIVGPKGPRRILDEMTVDPRDDASTSLAMWSGGGLIYTAALFDAWYANPKPGDVWDAVPGMPNPAAGHAMYLTGKSADGTYSLQTWGFNPPINLTPNGLKTSDPELIVAISLDQFDSNGICAFTGMTYDQKAAFWKQCGGGTLPPSPFPVTPPVPPPVPPPPPPAPPGTIQLAPGTYTIIVKGP
jgi:hypothetical protein